MAIGMKTWLGVLAVACVALAAWALPPRGPELRGLFVEQRRFSELLDEARGINGALQGRSWADSLSALVASEAEGGIAFGVPEDHPITEDGIAEWTSLVGAQVASLDRRDESVVLGFFAQPAAHGAQPDAPPYRFLGRVTFVGARDGTSYCIQVQTDRSNVMNSDLRQMARDGLGACRLYAIFGPPGSRIGEWLEAGALAFASPEGPRGAVRYPRLYDIRVPMFGMNRTLLSGLETSLHRCISGFVDACADFAANPQLWGRRSAATRFVLRNSPVAHLRVFGNPFGPSADYLLADLEAEMGAEAFTRFWTSEDDVASAFTAAFGVELGPWVMSWIEADFGLSRAGPSPRASALLLSLLTLMGLAAWVSARAMRRTVD